MIITMLQHEAGGLAKGREGGHMHGTARSQRKQGLAVLRRGKPLQHSPHGHMAHGNNEDEEMDL